MGGPEVALGALGALGWVVAAYYFAEARAARAYGDRAMRFTQTGFPEPREAVVVPAPPDAELRLQRSVSEATVRRGTERLMEMYREAGTPIAEEEARLLALSMLNGEVPAQFVTPGGTNA